MIYAAQKAIVEQIETLQNQHGIKTVGLYTGTEIEDLQNQVQNLTAIYLSQRSVNWNEFRTVKFLSVPVDVTYWILVFGYLGATKILDLNNNKVKDFDELFAALREKLIKFNTGYGYLRPKNEEILFMSDGFIGYGMEYEMTYTYKET